jgi:hypothetical protein
VRSYNESTSDFSPNKKTVFCRLFILVPGEILCGPNIFAVELYKSARIARRNNLSSLAALLIWKQIPFSFFRAHKYLWVGKMQKLSAISQFLFI